MKIELDLHTHTIASGHAFSTLQEMVAAASEKGLRALGITEHGPAVPGTCDLIYFRNIRVIPRLINGLQLLIGAEVNILDNSGNLDMDNRLLESLDLRIAGLHSQCYKPGTVEENTEGLIKVIRNPLIHIISHPGDGTAELDFEPLIIAAKESSTLLEVNNSSLHPLRNKIHARRNNLEILRLSKKYDVPVILGSDAHISYDVANYERLYPLLHETDFPETLIINTSLSSLKSYLNLSQT